MPLHWKSTRNSLEINEMPFYWRLSETGKKTDGIEQRLPIRIEADQEFDYLKINFKGKEWSILTAAYEQNATIGFINEESGQLKTYGSSVNKFFLESVQRFNPKKTYEIGCGAGISIQHMANHGWSVTGIDPSEYSYLWSQKLGFSLINDFFSDKLLDDQADFIFCNDVFEHIPDILNFSSQVFNCLDDEGVFCIATTNSTESIMLGDVSMLEHQHVNMFTEKSIYQILYSAGFAEVEVSKGSYGNTFHIIAKKTLGNKRIDKDPNEIEDLCFSFFDKVDRNLDYFGELYSSIENLNCYVPLRCMAYLSSVGDFGKTKIFESNLSWKGKFFDGYSLPIQSPDEIDTHQNAKFFIGSITFYKEIKRILVNKGVDESAIFSVLDIS